MGKDILSLKLHRHVGIQGICSSKGQRGNGVLNPNPLNPKPHDFGFGVQGYLDPPM